MYYKTEKSLFFKYKNTKIDKHKKFRYNCILLNSKL